MQLLLVGRVDRDELAAGVAGRVLGVAQVQQVRAGDELEREAPGHAVVPHDRGDPLGVLPGGRGVDLPALRRTRQPASRPRRAASASASHRCVPRPTRPAPRGAPSRRRAPHRRRSGRASRRSVCRRARTPRSACPCVPSLAHHRAFQRGGGHGQSRLSRDHRAKRMRQDLFEGFRARRPRALPRRPTGAAHMPY